MKIRDELVIVNVPISDREFVRISVIGDKVESRVWYVSKDPREYGRFRASHGGIRLDPDKVEAVILGMREGARIWRDAQ